LAELYGKNLDGRPFYRIVWSDSCTEKRVGTFNDFNGTIFTGQFKGMREVRKYDDPGFREKFILEKLIPALENQEVWDSAFGQGSYEPIWTFRGPNNSFQRPTLKAVEFLLGMIQGEKPKLTDKDINDLEEDLLAKETEENFEILNDVSPTAHALAHQEGIVVPTLNLESVDERCAMVRHARQLIQTPIRTAAVQNFAFGGVNTCLILRKVGA
jgi:hypothetical protein